MSIVEMRLLYTSHWFHVLFLYLFSHQIINSAPTVVTPDEQQVEQAMDRLQITDTQISTVPETGAVQPLSPPQETPQAPSQTWVVTPASPTAMPTSPSSILPTPPPSVGNSPMTTVEQTEQNCSAGQNAGTSTVCTGICFDSSYYYSYLP